MFFCWGIIPAHLSYHFFLALYYMYLMCFKCSLPKGVQDIGTQFHYLINVLLISKAIPPSIHKLLEHSSLITQTLQLPIGYYSEEPLEAHYKHLRNGCLNHTCKVSRLNTMTNHYNYMLTRTDLVVSSISFVKHKL